MIDLKKSAELNNMEPIELYAWFKKYPGSEKRVIAYCEECGKEREIRYSAYYDLCVKCANNNPIKCENLSKQNIEYWSHQENRDNATEKSNEYWSHQENCDKAAEKSNEYWSHQENRDDQGERMTQHYIDHPVSDKTREKKSERATEYYSHQENCDASSERFIKYYKDHPEAAIKISCGHRGIDVEDFDDFLYNMDDGTRNLPEVKEWRSNILERDNYTCQICYQCGGDLNIHHIRKWSEYPDLRLDINNGITLCVDCHLETFGKEDEYIEFLEKRLNQKVYIG